MIKALFYFQCILVFYSVSHAEQISVKKVKLGAIVSLTGPAAEQGKNWLMGAKLAVNDLKAESIHIELIIEDDSTQPARASSAFEKLVSVDGVKGIVGGTWDFLAETASPLAQRHKIPFVTPTNPVEVLSLSARSNPWFFTNGLSMGATLKELERVLKLLKVKSVSIVTPNVPFGTSHADSMERIAGKLGIEVISRHDFELAGYKDNLKSIALHISKKKPELVFCIADYAALSLFWKEIHRFNYSPWLITTQHLEEAVMLSNTPNLWEKAIGLYPRITNQEFRRKFTDKFGHAPKVYSAEGYDSIIFLGRAIVNDIALDTTPFVTRGVTGQLNSGGRTGISNIKAVALQTSSDGQLKEWGRVLRKTTH